MAGELNDALDVIVGYHGLAGFFNSTLEGRVLFDFKAIRTRAFAIHTSLHNGGHVLLDDFGAGNERCNFLLFLHFPFDILFDIWVININNNHLGRTTRGAA